MTQNQALKIMKAGVNVYLTGSAGSGKTHLLNKYISYLHEHSIPVAITASTGIAATHMNGMTIHGWSGIGIRDKIDERDLDELEEKKYLWKRYQKARVLIIDEISMLHGYQLDMIDLVCRKFKRNNKPFGGLQVILSGDFFQLPPVQKFTGLNDQKSTMAYTSNAWKNLHLAICYLDEQHRQIDQNLTEILNTIRDNNIDTKHYEQLQKRINADFNKSKKITKLYTHNRNVDKENLTELSKIKEEEKYFQMISTGSDILVSILKKSCLAHENLILKKGAEIMCIKNNFEEGFVNGTRGKIIDFDKSSGYPIIELYDSRKITISPMVWTIEENNKIKASLTQLPLRLAWAITIHKSQGMSLDNAEIDLGNTFAYGMGYVALSRVRTLEGIRLVGFHPDSLKVNPEVLEFDQDLKNESVQNKLLFKKLKDEQQNELEKKFILNMGGSLLKVKKEIKKKKIPTIEITKKYLLKKKTIKEIAEERKLKEGTILEHLEKICDKYKDIDIDIDYLKPKDKDIKLVQKNYSKLKKDEKNKLTPLKKLLEKDKSKLSFDDIRLIKLFIKK